MALQYEFPVVSTGNIGTVIDTYGSTISTQPPTNTPSNPNGALNPIGSAFLLSPGAPELPTAIYYPSASGSLNSNGWGAPVIVRYVRYNSTTNAAWLAYPAPVYWTDETFTTVSGTFSEGNPASTGNLNSLAGVAWLNTTIYPGSKTGAQLATLVNGNFIFIVTKGFVPACYVPGSCAVGDQFNGSSGNFTLNKTASGSTPSPFTVKLFTAVSASTSSAYADMWINCDPTF